VDVHEYGQEGSDRSVLFQFFQNHVVAFRDFFGRNPEVLNKPVYCSDMPVVIVDAAS
jgi:hypothetical protein